MAIGSFLNDAAALARQALQAAEEESAHREAEERARREAEEAARRAHARQQMQTYHGQMEGVLKDLRELYPVLGRIQQIKTDLEREHETQWDNSGGLPYRLGIVDIFTRMQSLMNTFQSGIRTLLGQPYNSMIAGVDTSLQVIRKKVDNLWEDYDRYHRSYVDAANTAEVCLTRQEMSGSSWLRPRYETQYLNE